MTEEVLGILQDTKAHLLENGWCQGAFHDAEGRACIYQALVASSNHSNRRKVRNMCIELITQCIDHPTAVATHAIFEWNDSFSRTENEVHALLDEVILKAKELQASENL